ncbi:GIY-YIG nuclease family protein [Mucilaginibacter sp. KACC 22063]|uniref:GIY-YIG nuclease family protein n=1 Tax=Mucilaginibacter sp. KACC 22063 TaxID=3025666 RepID=UPI002366BD01|nr:GIY-YIG nuclease family protein [Mucilaginibacter sp. KACC 22063]WDF57070.1 GIY-YIG nuclease family protein [Mucilaginibacter sp. KACC 22063]
MMIGIHQYYLYILTNKTNSVLYIGVTSNLTTRIWEHKTKVFKGFTLKYNCDKLVYFENYQWIQDAIKREKKLKAGPRQKKIDLILNEIPAGKILVKTGINSLGEIATLRSQ